LRSAGSNLRLLTVGPFRGPPWSHQSSLSAPVSASRTSPVRDGPPASCRAFTGYSTGTFALAIMRTGPSRPDSSNGSFFVQCFQVVNVTRPVGLGLFSNSHYGQRPNTGPQPWGTGLPGLEAGTHSQSLGNCSSPISRFGHRLTTLTTKSFAPAWRTSVTSTLKVILFT